MAHNAIRYFRTTSGQSQEDIAKQAGMSVSTLSRLERVPLTDVPPYRLERIAKALGTTVWVLARVQRGLAVSLVALWLAGCGAGGDGGSSAGIEQATETAGPVEEVLSPQEPLPAPETSPDPETSCERVSVTWIGHQGLPLPRWLLEGIQVIQTSGQCEEGACAFEVHGIDAALAQALLWERHADSLGRAWVSCMGAAEAYDAFLYDRELYWWSSRYADWQQAWQEASVDGPSGATVDGNYIWEYVPDVGAGGQDNVLEPGEEYEDEDMHTEEE